MPTDLPTVAPRPVLADFGDWISPMIVKELRQGLRTSVFAGVFIILQAMLAMVLLVTSSAGNAEATNELFWYLIAGILVFIIPLRGFNALASEMSGQTLDLLVLTRLDSFRIAFGKWIALVAQAVLIAVAIMPYVVLRYYAGGIDPLGDLVGLLLMLLASALLTAMAIAVSALPSIILRVLLMLVVGAGAIGFIILIVEMLVDQEDIADFFDFPGSSAFSTRLILTLLGMFWAFLCYFILEMAATPVAPRASNGATRKRCFVLVLVTCLVNFIVISEDRPASAIAFFCLLVIGGLATIDCLTESPTFVPSVYAPFARLGRIGRLASHLLAPGWTTGIFFYAVLAGLAGLAFEGLEIPDRPAAGLVLLNVLFSPLTLLGLALMFCGASRSLLVPCVVTGLAMAALCTAFALLAEEGLAHDTELAVATLSGLTAPTALAFHVGYLESYHYARYDGSSVAYLHVGVVSGVIFACYVVVKAWKPLRLMRLALSAAAAEASVVSR